MLEKDIEKWLVEEVKKMGGLADKYVSPNNPGVPDRIVIMPGGRVFFVELKTQWGRLSSLQKWQRKRYEGVGAQVRCVRGMDGAKAFVEELRDGIQTT